MSVMTVYHHVTNLGFEADDLLITIDGKDFRFSLTTVSKRLQNASKEQRLNFEISASGYGVHWPAIDEDLSVDGFLRQAGVLK